MRYGLSGAGVAVYGDSLLLTGGVGKSGGILKAVKRFLIYNLRTNTWSEGPEMITARKSHSCGMFGNRLYVAGGTDDQMPVSTSEFIDLDAPLSAWEWKTAADLAFWHNGVSFLRFGSKMAVLSSYSAENDKIFQPEVNSWTALPVRSEDKNRICRDRCGVAKVGGNIVVAGGVVGRTLTKEVESYDFDSQLWEMMPSLNVPREGCGLVEVHDKVFAVGGRGSKGTTECLEEGKWTVLEFAGPKLKDDEYVALEVKRIVWVFLSFQT